MKLQETFTYPGADVEAVYAVTTDPEFRREAAEAVGSKDIEVTIEPDGDGHVVTIIRSQPADLPDSIKKFTGDAVKVKQTERWSAPDASGTRTADLKVNMIGQPAEVVGTLTIAGPETTLTIAGDAKVNVPFFGKKIEPVIVKAVIGALRSEVELGRERLGQ
jgi:hypothetical protein